MTPDRKKPGVAFWAIVVVVVAVLYILSIGPACWISSRMKFGASAVTVVYRPLQATETSISWPLWNWLIRYSEAGAAEGWNWAQTWRRAPTSRGWHYRVDWNWQYGGKGARRVRLP